MPPPVAEQHRQNPERAASCDQSGMEMDAAVERGGEPLAVRHHQEAAAGARHQIARQRQHLVGGGLVEIAGRLVGEQQQRF